MKLLPNTPFCYLVIGKAHCLHHSLFFILEAAIRGGISMVQLREKTASTEERIHMAHSLMPLLNQYHIPLIINDDITAAATLQVGVHLGQQDETCYEARKRLGSHTIIGISVDTPHQANNLPPEADYVGIGPIFPTQSKKDATPPWGLDNVKEIRKRIKGPLIAIGGIDAHNVSRVMATGVEGIAVISYITHAHNPQKATETLCALLKKEDSPHD